jgi:protein-disulfide isomerase
MKKYMLVLLIVELQVILVLLILSLVRMSEINVKHQRTNRLLFELYTNKKLEDISILREGDIVVGSDNAPVTIIMYTKLDCSLCNEFLLTEFKKIKANYIDNGLVKYVIRSLSHKDNIKVFYAVKCASYCSRNNVFEAFLDGFLNADFDEIDTTYIKDLTLDLVPGMEDFNAYITDPVVTEMLFQKAFMARQAGINKVPTFIIDEHMIIGNRRYERMEEIILTILSGEEFE